MFPEGRAFEFLIVAIVALVVVGPKDLPILLRKVGQFMAKVRSMAAEFRASFDEMARQSELDELRKEVEAMRKGQLTDIATHAPEVNQAFEEISQGLSDVGVQLNAPATPPDIRAQTATIEVDTPTQTRKRKAVAAKKAGSKTAARKPATSKPPPKAKAATPRAQTVTEATKARKPPAKPRARKATVS